MIELKPCPFCGGSALLKHEHAGLGTSYIQCEKCGLESVKFMRSFEIASDKEAIKFWNTRYDNGKEKQ